MRFYRTSRNYRIWGSVLWGALLLFWIPTYSLHHTRHPWQPLVWIVLAATQLGSLWTWWDITPTELVAQSFGFHRSYQLSAIDQVGPPAPHRRMLAKTVQVDYRGRQTLYISVADRDVFERALRTAVLSHDRQPPTTGPLGLSV